MSVIYVWFHYLKSFNLICFDKYPYKDRQVSYAVFCRRLLFMDIYITFFGKAVLHVSECPLASH